MFGSKKKKPDRDEHLQPLLFEPEPFPEHLPQPEDPQLFAHGNFPGMRLFRVPEYPGKTFIFEEVKKEPERDEHLQPLPVEPEYFPAHLLPPENPQLFVHGNFPGLRLFRDAQFPGKTFVFEEQKKEKKAGRDEDLDLLTPEVEDYPVDIPPPEKIRLILHDNFPGEVLFRSPEFPGRTFYYAKRAYVETRTPWYEVDARQDETTLPEAHTDKTRLPEALHVTEFEMPESPGSQDDCDKDSDTVACKAARHASTKYVKASVEDAHTTDISTEPSSSSASKLGCDEDTGCVPCQGINENTKGVRNTIEDSYSMRFETTSMQEPELVVGDCGETTAREADHASSQGRLRKLFESFYLGKPETTSLHRPTKASEDGPRVGTANEEESVGEDRVKETVENFCLTDFQSTSSQSPEHIVAAERVTLSETALASSKGCFRELGENFYLDDSNTFSPHKPSRHVGNGATSFRESSVKDTVPNFYLTDFQSKASHSPEVAGDKHHDSAQESPDEVVAESHVNETIGPSGLPEFWTRIPSEPEHSEDAHLDQSNEVAAEEVTGVEDRSDGGTEEGGSGATFEDTTYKGLHHPGQSTEDTTGQVTGVKEGSDGDTEDTSSGATSEESIDQLHRHPKHFIEAAPEEAIRIEEGSKDDTESASNNATTAETINEGHYPEAGDDEVQNTNDRGAASNGQTAHATLRTENETPQDHKVPRGRNIKIFLKSIFGIDNGSVKRQSASVQDPPSQVQHTAQDPVSLHTDAVAPTTPVDVGPETNEVVEETVPPQQEIRDDDDLAERCRIYIEAKAYRDEQFRKSQEDFAARLKSYSLEDITELSGEDSKTTDHEPIVTTPEPIVADPEPFIADPMVGLEFEAEPDQTFIVTASTTEVPTQPKSCTPCIRGDPWAPRMPNHFFGREIPDCETFCQGLIGVIIVFYFFRPDKLPAFIRHTFGRFISPYDRRMWSWLRLLTGIVIFIRIASFGLPDGLFEIVCDYPDEPEDHWPQIWYYPEHAIPFFAPKNGDMTPERRW